MIKQGLKGKTVVYTSRKKRFIDFCDQFVVLEKGRIKAQGTFEDLNRFFQGVKKDREEEDRPSINPVSILFNTPLAFEERPLYCEQQLQ